MDFNGQKLSQEQQNQLLFMMLVQQHEQICMMSLGKLKNPATDKIERDVPSAKYAIDTLAMLEQFTQNNLSAELKSFKSNRLIQDSLLISKKGKPKAND